MPIVSIGLLVCSIAVSVRVSSGGWVDPDSNVLETESLTTGATYQLVYSDEFEVEGRNFADGNDPRWTALDKNDYTNDALQYYRSDYATTKNGYLNISTVNKDVTFTVRDANGVKKMTKNFQTAMLQGWNKFCFVGGAVEISAKLPGREDVGGLWPALWLMGNLARSTYVSSSQNMWPWSFDSCSRKDQRGQEISACNAVNHYDMHPFQGRGSPEVDILEAMMGKQQIKGTATSRPYYSASLQVSPALSQFHPQDGLPPHTPWYKDGLAYGDDTSLNVFFYGSNLGSGDLAYSTDALSANHNLNTSKFDAFHSYRLEWESGDSGYLRWYFDNKLVYSINSKALKMSGAIIPEEPMYVILNTALSRTWGFPSPCPAGCSCQCFNCERPECSCGLGEGFCEMLPAGFLIDYVRVFQDPHNAAHTVGCSPSSHPTSKFIEGHKERYMSEADVDPLKPIRRGGGPCSRDSDCGPSKAVSGQAEVAGTGTCVNRLCRCPAHLVGPNCLAYDAFDQVAAGGSDDDWFMDPSDVDLYIPTSMLLVFICFSLASIAAVYVKYRSNVTRNRIISQQSISADVDS